MNCEFDWQGQTFVATPHRALIWPAQRLVLVADVHLGKEATFRRHGIPMPEGTDAAVLAALAQLAADYQGFELMVLGDFFHGVGEPAGWSEELAARTTLIRGNHDRWQAGRAWVRDAGRQEVREGIRLAHEPSDCTPEIVGHLHPGFRMGRRRGLSRPCFHVQRDRIVLPAFSPFTGLSLVARGVGERVIVVGEERVALV